MDAPQRRPFALGPTQANPDHRDGQIALAENPGGPSEKGPAPKDQAKPAAVALMTLLEGGPL